MGRLQKIIKNIENLINRPILVKNFFTNSNIYRKDLKNIIIRNRFFNVKNRKDMYGK
jgi:hypothetical protein